MLNDIDLDIKKTLLRKQACFSPLTEDEVDVLASLLSEKTFEPGDVIVREGEPVDSVYLILEGTVDVRRALDKDHPEQLTSVATLGADMAIGLNESGFYSISGIRTATVVALSQVVVLRLSVAAFHGFALAYSHVNEVMRDYARKAAFR